MALTFRKNQSVRRAVKRLARKRLCKALNHLETCEKLEAVHEVRKDIKQLRALLRLVREAMPRSRFRVASRLLRKAAADLGIARDAHVKVSALRHLIAHYKSQLPAHPFFTIGALLTEDSRSEQSRLSAANAPRKVCQRLKTLCTDSRCFKIKGSGWAAIRPGIERSYDCGRHSCELAQKTDTPQEFHEWRKRVKDLFYQVGLLRPIWPEQLAAVESELKRLSEYLGDDHDLFLLTEPALLKRFNKKAPKEASYLTALAARRQRQLRSKAILLGSRFYREKPAVFSNRLGQYWARWRHGSSRAVPAV
jgi:CHAD domain-containing protein